jgi:PhoH-like ATPase
MPLPKAPTKPATILDLSDLPRAKTTAPALLLTARPGKPPSTVKPPSSALPSALPASLRAPGESVPKVVALTPNPALRGAKAPMARGKDSPPAGSGEPASTKRALPPPPKARDSRLRTRNSGPTKLFVIDTNVLMHDPSALFRFDEHDVFLPMMTLEELDNHKKGMSEVSRNARSVSRTLDELMAKAQSGIETGLPLDSLGNTDATGRLLFQTRVMDSLLPASLPAGKADNQILSVVRALQEQQAGREIVLVSKDINMRIKARTLGLAAEDYFNDQVLEDSDLLYSGLLQLPVDFWDKHGKGIESWQQGGHTFSRVTGPLVSGFMLNQFVFFEGQMPLAAQVKEINGRSAVLQTLKDFTHHKNAVWGITTRNREQNFAMNLLMNPEVDFVTLLGQAGTGKTLLALAAGLAQTIDARRFTEIIMTRATVPVGDEIGFLPGTEEEKMQPWMGALEDNLEVLQQGDPAAGEWGKQATQDMIRSRIRIKSMSFMRGRTFINKFLIIDEAQNLTPKQMKTLITRAGPGTKVVCLGNIAQIDTPYLTEGSSGLTYVVDRFKGWVHAGHITLQRGERSRLADFAAEAL